MGVNIKSKAVSHLEMISPKEISLLASSETVGILLPTTAVIMQLKRPPAREMLKAGCIVALGSDFNPNAYCYAMVYDLFHSMRLYSYILVDSLSLW